MILPSHLSPVILSATTNQIAPLFMAETLGDQQAARDTATTLLADFKPNTNEELTLAADIVHYKLLAVDSLKRSFDLELPLTKVLRLRSNAVSLSREAHKSQRRLEKLQAARAVATSGPTAQPEHAQPEHAQTAAAQTAAAQSAAAHAPPTPAELAALHAARQILNGKKPIKPATYGGHAAAQQLRKRQMVQTMNENAARRAEEHARRTAEKAAAQAA